MPFTNTFNVHRMVVRTAGRMGKPANSMKIYRVKCGHRRCHTISGGLDADNVHRLVVEERMEQANGVAT